MESEENKATVEPINIVPPISPQTVQQPLKNSHEFRNFIIFVILLTPVSFITCADVWYCRGPVILLSVYSLPFILFGIFLRSLPPIMVGTGSPPSALSIIKPVLLSYIISFILFALFWRYSTNIIEKQQHWTIKEKKLIKIFAYICYWLFVIGIWLLVPQEILEALFGPNFHRNNFVDEIFSINGLNI